MSAAESIKPPEFVLSPDQQSAIDMASEFMAGNDKFMSLIGPAGSGKSTIVKLILEMIKQRRDGREIYLTATTHKAAANLREITRSDAGTIHSLLKVKIKRDFKTGVQSLEIDDNKFSKYDYHNSVIFCDEASMFGEQLMKIAQDVAKKINVKFIFIGDAFQLSPVGEDDSIAVDKDKCEWKIAELTTVHRQAADNPIIALATDIRLGNEIKWPTESGFGTGTFMLDQDKFVSQFIQQAKRNDVENRCVCFRNIYADKCNQRVRVSKYGTKADPYVPDELMVSNSTVSQAGSQLIRNNDEVVIQSVKHDGIFWNLEVINMEQEKVGVRAMDNFSERKSYLDSMARKARKDYTWSEFYAESDAIADLRPVYAGTTHKAQGSTYHDTYIDLNEMYRCSNEVERARLLYTAVTRASNAVYLTGK